MLTFYLTFLFTYLNKFCQPLLAFCSWLSKVTMVSSYHNLVVVSHTFWWGHCHWGCQKFRIFIRFSDEIFSLKLLILPETQIFKIITPFFCISWFSVQTCDASADFSCWYVMIWKCSFLFSLCFVAVLVGELVHGWFLFFGYFVHKLWSL